MARAIRSASKRTGITIRTRTAQAIFPENSPQNYVPFGASSISAGAGANLLGAPATGKTWIILSLFVSTDAINGAGCSVAFTGGLAALFQSFGGGAVVPQQLINPNAPFPVGAATAFAYTSIAIAGASHFSVSGVAYQATIPAGYANAQQSELIAVAQDGNPSTDLG
jgi:hypothetical protein